MVSNNWPLILNSKFFPNFAMEYMENSFKAWVDDIDQTGIGTGSKVPFTQYVDVFRRKVLTYDFIQMQT